MSRWLLLTFVTSGLGLGLNELRCVGSKKHPTSVWLVSTVEDMLLKLGPSTLNNSAMLENDQALAWYVMDRGEEVASHVLALACPLPRHHKPLVLPLWEIRTWLAALHRQYKQGSHRPFTLQCCPKVKLCRGFHKRRSQVHFTLAAVSRSREGSQSSANIVPLPHSPLNSVPLQRYRSCRQHCSLNINPQI